MKLVPQGITRSIGRTILKTKKNSPHIFFVGGIIGVGVSTFLACRATLKLEETLDSIKDDIDDVKEATEADNDNIERRVEVNPYKDFKYVGIKSVVTLGKLYGPSIVIGCVSVAALTGSHVQLTRRNAAISATLAIVSKAYEDYRLRVQEDIGKARELDIYRNMQKQEIDVDGKKKTVKLIGPNGCSPYARFFDESCKNWQNNSEMNRIFLNCQENYANHLLTARGHVFLNEVYDQIGLERSQAGQVVGWIYNGDGDNYIDFGLNEEHNVHFRNMLLDFNIDGVVYDKI